MRLRRVLNILTRLTSGLRVLAALARRENYDALGRARGLRYRERFHDWLTGVRERLYRSWRYL